MKRKDSQLTCLVFWFRLFRLFDIYRYLRTISRIRNTGAVPPVSSSSGTESRGTPETPPSEYEPRVSRSISTYQALALPSLMYLC